ncbi:hypothetical protein Q7P37_001101 [Cladosporium fusiforme]
MMWSLRLSLLMCLTRSAICGQTLPSWNRPNDRSLSGIKLEDYDCGQQCQKFISKGIETDRSGFGGAPFDADFYRTARNFSAETSKPGDILKLKPYINATSSWDLPGGATLYLMQYVSVGQGNKKVPATAFVVLPFAERLHNKPFPVVAYAHGTIGTFYGCAPSSSYNLYDYDTWRQLYLSGYAIVATDYAGLGNNYTAHHYLSSTLAAKDVYYSVIAAKKTFGKLLSNKWASTGHSQGGGTVWGLIESQYVTRNAPNAHEVPLEFVGGVAISPAPRIADIARAFVLQNETTTLCAYAPFIHDALEAVNPGSASTLFTSTMEKRIALGRELGVCLESGGSLGLDLCPSGDVYKNLSLLSESPSLQSFQSEFGAGQGKRAQAPMLVVQSKGDNTVPWSVTLEAWEATCKAKGHPIELSIYPALDHSATPGASSGEWMKWLSGRFEKKQSARHCRLQDYTAVDVADAYLPEG